MPSPLLPWLHSVPTRGPAPPEARQRRQGVTLLCLGATNVTPPRRMVWPRPHPSSQDSIACQLARVLRAEDTVSDLDGGLFGCLLAGTPTRERLYLLSWRLLDSLYASLQPAAGRWGQRAGLGIAVAPADGVNCHTLFINARAAMVRARALGCGVSFYDRRLDIWAAQP